MDCLKRLVNSQGMTVVAVIHQPRTDIYDMFDSLILLGLGGRTVYHGPATKCRDYFEKMGYKMKEGESQADWFLDISSGDIQINDVGTTATRKPVFDFFGNSFEVVIWPSDENGPVLVLGQPEGVELGNILVKDASKVRYATATPTEHMIQVNDKVIGIDGLSICQMNLDEATALLKKHDDPSYVHIQLMRQQVENDEQLEKGIDDEEESRLINPSNQDAAMEKSRMAREKLYRQWDLHFENLSHLPFFNPPDAFPLPIMPKPVPGWHQLLIQIRRNCLLSWRNKDARLIDAGIVIVAIFLVTLLTGRNEIEDFDADPKGNYTVFLVILSRIFATIFLTSVYSSSSQRCFGSSSFPLLKKPLQCSILFFTGA